LMRRAAASWEDGTQEVAILAYDGRMSTTYLLLAFVK
jgi:hypothetical protein